MTLQPLFPLTQQFQNKNGAILTGGKVYIYYQGRTALATTYHDEEGTVVNPNPVLLDNNGRATVFVNTIYSYTIVVCDYYGKELFSQDITLHDAISTAKDVLVMGSDGSVKVDTTTLPNGVQYNLSVNTDIIATKKSVDDVKTDLNNLTGKVDNHTTQIGQIQENIDGIESTIANKKDKQIELNFNGSATKTVKKITQNVNGELNVEFEDIDLPGYSISSSDGSINVSTSEGVTDLTLPNDVVRDPAYTHIDAASANPLMDGNTSVGVSTKYAREDHVHPSDSSKEDIANKTTVVLGTSDSKYPTDKAVAEFVNSSISNSIDQKYSYTSTKAQSGAAVNEAFKTRETSRSDASYTYLGMNITSQGTEELYWKLVSFKAARSYWSLQFEVDVSNGRKANGSYDTEIYETKRLTICGTNPGSVIAARELRYVAQGLDPNRGYGNNIYFEIGSDNLVTVYIKAIDKSNKRQICRLKDVRNMVGISDITWYESVNNAGTQPTHPVKFTELFPAIASTLSDIGSNSVPVYINKGKPLSCNSSNLKAGKDDVGNVIKNTYATKTELNAKQNSLTAGKNITIDGDTISSNQVFVATYGTTTYQEIKDAYDAGKICAVFKDKRYYYIKLIDTASITFASSNGKDTLYSLTVSSADSWSTYTGQLQSKLTFDSAPTDGSNNPVTSKGIKSAIDTINAKGLTVKEISGEQVICFE